MTLSLPVGLSLKSAITFLAAFQMFGPVMGYSAENSSAEQAKPFIADTFTIDGSVRVKLGAISGYVTEIGGRSYQSVELKRGRSFSDLHLQGKDTAGDGVLRFLVKADQEMDGVVSFPFAPAIECKDRTVSLRFTCPTLANGGADGNNAGVWRIGFGATERSFAEDDTGCYVECRREAKEIVAQFFLKQGREVKAVSKVVRVANADGVDSDRRPQMISLVLDLKAGNLAGLAGDQAYVKSVALVPGCNVVGFKHVKFELDRPASPELKINNNFERIGAFEVLVNPPMPESDQSVASQAIRPYHPNLAALEESRIPIRPGEPGKQPFWNSNAVMFIYAPAFDFAEVVGVVNYRFTVQPASGKPLVFTAEKPWAALSPIWKQLPDGNAKVSVEGINSVGKSVGVAGTREFYRQAVFCADEPKPAMPFDESWRVALKALVHSPDLACWWKSSTWRIRSLSIRFACSILT